MTKKKISTGLTDMQEEIIFINENIYWFNRHAI